MPSNYSAQFSILRVDNNHVPEMLLPKEVHQLDQGVVEEHSNGVLNDVGSKVDTLSLVKFQSVLYRLIHLKVKAMEATSEVLPWQNHVLISLLVSTDVKNIVIVGNRVGMLIPVPLTGKSLFSDYLILSVQILIDLVDQVGV